MSHVFAVKASICLSSQIACRRASGGITKVESPNRLEPDSVFPTLVMTQRPQASTVLSEHHFDECRRTSSIGNSLGQRRIDVNDCDGPCWYQTPSRLNNDQGFGADIGRPNDKPIKIKLVIVTRRLCWPMGAEVNGLRSLQIP